MSQLIPRQNAYDRSEWTVRAACRPGIRDSEGKPKTVPNMFPHDQDHEGAKEAKDFCLGCPVRTECLSDALDRGETQGIWGGTDPDERRIMRTGKRGRPPGPRTVNVMTTNKAYKPFGHSSHNLLNGSRG